MILQSLYFILPAYVANMCPVIAAALHLPFNIPLSEKWFGPHKTHRGIVFGVLGAIGMVWIQRELQLNGIAESLRVLDYTQTTLPRLGALFGGGALLGDALKSFVKRRLGKPSGSAWFPFDQLDFVVGAIALVSFVYVPSWEMVGILLVVSPVLHLMVNIGAYCLGWKKVWW